jgi:hypothetical protein
LDVAFEWIAIMRFIHALRGFHTTARIGKSRAFGSTRCDTPAPCAAARRLAWQPKASLHASLLA